MNYETVCEQIETQLATITGLRVGNVAAGTPPPFAILDWPDEIRFDETYGRGADSMTVPLAVAVGRPAERTTRSRLAVYCNGTGSESIKAVLEAGTYTAFDSIRVTDVKFATWSEGGIDYATAVFGLEIMG